MNDTTAPTITTDDLNRIATDLNGKADKDLTNIEPSQVGGGIITMLSAPDYSAMISNVGNNYTAPSDGIYSFSLANQTTTSAIYVNDVAIAWLSNYNLTGGYMVPIAKGDRIYVRSTTQTLAKSVFIPFKGAA